MALYHLAYHHTETPHGTRIFNTPAIYTPRNHHPTGIKPDYCTILYPTNTQESNSSHAEHKTLQPSLL